MIKLILVAGCFVLLVAAGDFWVGRTGIAWMLLVLGLCDLAAFWKS